MTTLLKIIGERGHYRPGADTNHFLGLCDECDARYLVGMTLEQAESWSEVKGERGKAGAIRQAVFEAYMHVWATGAVRFSSLADGWRAEPVDPEVNELVAEIREAAREREDNRR